jgi:RNA polymerase sigma-70 factor, ECF subfamily
MSAAAKLEKKACQGGAQVEDLTCRSSPDAVPYADHCVNDGTAASRLLTFEWPMAVDRAAEFEKEALPHAGSLLRYAMHIAGRGKAEAEDLVQETLLAAWRNFGQFEAGTNCKAWLFRILVNFRYKQLRRASRKAEVQLAEEEPNLSRSENISRSAEVRAAFALLSPEHREVMQLAVVEGFEIREIGEMLRIPPGTVMSRLSRARAQLRTVLQGVRPSPRETL